MKKVTFEVAKKIKILGFPQENTKQGYIIDNWNNFFLAGDIVDYADFKTYEYHLCDIPTYFEVYNWLWEKYKFFVKIHVIKDKFHYQILDYLYNEWHSWGIVNIEGYDNPESAMIGGIEYIINNDIIKNK